MKPVYPRGLGDLTIDEALRGLLDTNSIEMGATIVLFLLLTQSLRPSEVLKSLNQFATADIHNKYPQIGCYVVTDMVLNPDQVQQKIDNGYMDTKTLLDGNFTLLDDHDRKIFDIFNYESGGTVFLERTGLAEFRLMRVGTVYGKTRDTMSADMNSSGAMAAIPSMHYQWLIFLSLLNGSVKKQGSYD